MTNNHPSIRGALADAIRRAAIHVCAGRPGFDCMDELTPARVRAAMDEVAPDALPAFDAAPKAQVRAFILRTPWWQ